MKLKKLFMEYINFQNRRQSNTKKKQVFKHLFFQLLFYFIHSYNFILFFPYKNVSVQINFRQYFYWPCTNSNLRKYHKNVLSNTRYTCFCALCLNNCFFFVAIINLQTILLWVAKIGKKKLK